jgi:hypothetical protein
MESLQNPKVGDAESFKPVLFTCQVIWLLRFDAELRANSGEDFED